MKREPIIRTAINPEYPLRYELTSTSTNNTVTITTKDHFTKSKENYEKRSFAKRNKVDLSTVEIDEIEATVLHSEDSPAIVKFYENGNVKEEHWFKYGKKHREDGAAITWYDEAGNIEFEGYRLDGKMIEKHAFENLHRKKPVVCDTTGK